jgi:hypothetical protein
VRGWSVIAGRFYYIRLLFAHHFAARRTNLDYLTTHVYPTLEYRPTQRHHQVSDPDATQPAGRRGILLHGCLPCVRSDQSGLAEAVDQEVLERNVARETVIPEIEESDKPVLPVEMYAKLLAGLDGIRDRAIFLIACFCACDRVNFSA